jgi:hypothetical protein
MAGDDEKIGNSNLTASLMMDSGKRHLLVPPMSLLYMAPANSPQIAEAIDPGMCDNIN